MSRQTAERHSGVDFICKDICRRLSTARAWESKHANSNVGGLYLCGKGIQDGKEGRYVGNMDSFTFPERLEQRIAPAGLVTVTFSKGLITIDGSDGADHDVTIVRTGTNTYRVTGDGTDIDVVGQTSKNLRGTLKHLLFEGGTGADSFEVMGLGGVESFRFHGGAGVDSLKGFNFKTSTGGWAEISLGAEGGMVEFAGSETRIRGFLDLDLGGGGTVDFRAVVTRVHGNAAMTGGPNSDTVSLSGDSVVFKRKLTFDGGEGDDSFTASGRSFAAVGFVTMLGGGGANTFEFAAAHNYFGAVSVVGIVDIDLGVGAGRVSFSGQSNSVLADLRINLGVGGGLAELVSGTTTIRNNVMLTGGIGNDAVSISGRTTIGKSLSFFGNAGDDRLSATGSLLGVKGSTSMDGGSGASRFELDVVSLALADLGFVGGTVNDLVSIVADGVVAGNASVQLGLDGIGPSSVVLQSRVGNANGLQFGAALTIDMVGATIDTLTIANIQVMKDFVAQTGEDVSTVAIAKLNAKRDFKLQTGSGADVTTIDNVNARDFYVDTQIGADELRIERSAIYTGVSRVSGIATILTGIGADEVRIGNSIDPANLRVSFMGAMTFDAGDGANMRNDIVGSNFFRFIPQILTTGGTLTQTEAV